MSARLPPATVKEEPVKKVLVKAVPNLSKEVALELLDAAAAQARLGMNGKSHNEEREPLDKNEFVREVMGLLQVRPRLSWGVEARADGRRNLP